MRVADDISQIYCNQNIFHIINQKNQKSVIARVNEYSRVPVNTFNTSTNSRVITNLPVVKYTNLYTGEKIELSKTQILSLCREFARWCRDDPSAFTPLIFWNERGMTYEMTQNMRKLDPEIDSIFQLAHEIVGCKRENRLQNDLVHIRNRQVVYVREYDEFERERMKFKAELQANINKEKTLSPEEIQAIIKECFPPIQKKPEVTEKIIPHAAKVEELKNAAIQVH